MESTTERQVQQGQFAKDVSDAEISSTFRGWTQTMSAKQIRYLLAHCSAEGLEEYSLQNNLPAYDSYRIWRLLKEALVNRLQSLTAPADPDEIEFVRRWADGLTIAEAVEVLAHGSPEAYNTYLQARQMPTLHNLYRLWALFEIELSARTEGLNPSHGNVGTA